MAQHTIIRTIDDIDGTDRDVRTVTFALQGRDYQIDLAPHNEDTFMAALAPFLERARAVHGYARRQGTARPRVRNAEAAEARAWALAQGMQVSTRGRVSQSLVEAYRASQEQAGEKPARRSRKAADKAADGVDAESVSAAS